MAITYAEYWALNDGTVSNGGDITSASISVVTGDLITVTWQNADVGSIGTVSISNTGTALTWNAIATASASSNCHVQGWWATATASESITISTLNSSATSINASQSVIVHTGAHATTPVPAGNKFSGTSANDASQSITPTSAGSCLWMALADWTASNALTANANCTAMRTDHVDGQYTAAIIRPTTQPRTDTNAFTIGEASDADSSETTAWIAWEVQAAASSQSNTPRTAAYYRMMRSR